MKCPICELAPGFRCEIHTQSFQKSQNRADESSLHLTNLDIADRRKPVVSFSD